MSAVVTLSQISVSFFGNTVLHDVSLSFPGAGVFVLVGRSGSGKTTLLRSINRLNEEFPGCVTKGSVTVDFGSGPLAVYEAPVKGARGEISLTGLRMKLGMLFQTPNLFPVSAYRNIAMPLQLIGGVSERDIPGAVEAALGRVGLWRELKDRLQVPASRLSGGQQQRLCLARLLALDPSVLLLDEPTASLDVHSAREIEDLLLELSCGYTVIMVSHSLSQARRMGGEIVVCENGRLTGRIAAGEAPSEEMLAALL